MKYIIRFSRYVTMLAGNPLAFLLSCLIIAVWLLTGPIFGFSDTWQLVINTGTSLVTFVMVFVIQSSQNRDGEAIQIKLDELIRAHEGAHNILLDLEELSQEELEVIKERYEVLARKAREALEKGEKDTSSPDLML